MLSPNTVLQGRYSIVKELGQGGMGAVYLAHDNRFQGRPVALKETLVDRARLDLRKQFEREALLLFDLKHQALPRVIDYFSEGQGEFLVMEFVEGRDFSELLARNGGPFDVAQVVAWAEQLLDALAYLHTQDPPVIHRDIKPSNVKLTPKGQVVLLDFGLAKGALMAQSRMLSGSVVAGTPAYAPLEQMNGQGTDVRSDLYSLAATMYTLLSNRLPADAGMRATEILNGRPDPLVSLQEIVPGFSEAMWWTLRSTLSLAKDGRPRSAVEMRAALREALTHAPGQGARATILAGVPVVPDAPRPTEFQGGGHSSVPNSATPTQLAPPVSSGTSANDPHRSTVPGQFQSTMPLTGQPSAPHSAPSAAPPPVSAPPVAHVSAPPPVSVPPPPVSVQPPPQHSAPVSAPPLPAPALPISYGAPEPTIAARPPERSRSGLALLSVGLVALLGAGAVLGYLYYPRTPSPQPAAPVEPAPKPATPTTVAPAPAPAPVYVGAVRWRFERKDGTPIDTQAGPVATGEEFRIRFTSPKDARIYLLAPDAKGTYRAFLTDQPSADTNTKTNAIGPGKDVVFPGLPLTLSVTEGETRFLAVLAGPGDVVPAPLRGPALAALAPADVESLKEMAKDSADSIKTESEYGDISVRRLEGETGTLVFEIVITGRAGGRR